MEQQKKLTPHVFSILKDKIKRIDNGDEAIYLVGPIQLPVNLHGETSLFHWYCWLNAEVVTNDYQSIIEKLSSANLADSQQSSVLVYGDFAKADNALVRMHSICHTGDIFGSKRCDCGFQLREAMLRIKDNGSGALFYLANHEGRGIGLFSKAMAYILQENGYDTVEANESLGFVNDSRNYMDALRVLKQLRQKPVTVITNNPEKLDAFNKAGVPIHGRTPLWGDISEYNRNYLQTKVTKSGHYQPEGALLR